MANKLVQKKRFISQKITQLLESPPKTKRATVRYEIIHQIAIFLESIQ